MSDTGPAHVPDDPTALAAFGRLELIARQLVEGLMMGRHRSPWKGSSVEFVEHREYSPGDEIRHIDWRAFGKTGRYYIKEFEDETNLRATILADASGSMGYAGKTLSKFSYARILAASLGWLLLRQRDAVGLTVFDHRIQQSLPPSANRDAWRRLTETLESTEPGGETALSQCIDDCTSRLTRRSLVFLISDCFDEPEALRESLTKLRHGRHEVVVFRIVAPEEEEFPFEQPIRFRNLEARTQLVPVDPSRLKQEYLRQYHHFADTLREICGSLGVDYCVFRTDRPFRETMGQWLSERLHRNPGRR